MSTEKALESLIKMMDRVEEGPPAPLKSVSLIKVLRKRKPKDGDEEEEPAEESGDGKE